MLAQIYKRRDKEGASYGGPAYYIEKALHAHILAKLFCVCLIATYAFGFNLLCSYNLQSSFAVYPFYDVRIAPVLAGTALATITAVCLMGGGERTWMDI